MKGEIKGTSEDAKIKEALSVAPDKIDTSFQISGTLRGSKAIKDFLRGKESMEEADKKRPGRTKKTHQVPLHTQTANVGALNIPNHYDTEPRDNNQEEEPHGAAYGDSTDNEFEAELDAIFGKKSESPILDKEEKTELLEPTGIREDSPVEFEKVRYVTLEKVKELIAQAAVKIRAEAYEEGFLDGVASIEVVEPTLDEILAA